MDKKELRAQMRERKKAMTQEQISAASHELTALLERHPLWKNASTVYLYLSINQEVRTDALIRSAWNSGKKVAVPLVTGDEMEFRFITSPEDLHPGFWNVPEPDVLCPLASVPDALVILPGLAFDPQGYRLGYGKGFYDRFLARESLHPTLALCYAFQMVASVPHTELDLPADEVICSTLI